MPVHSIEFTALGVPWRIDTTQKLSEHTIATIHQRIETFDQVYSRFRSDSLVTQVAKKAGTYTFPPDVMPLMALYRKLYNITAGKFTPLIGMMLERAGYDARYSFREQSQVALPQWDTVMNWQETTLATTRPITIDIGAAGKGYSVDHIADILHAAGYSDYAIDASGDIRHHGITKNQVGLEHPFDPRKVIGTVDGRGKSICASASNRRKWGNQLHHIFDPDTKAPVQDIVATWVIADTALIADGLATALFFVSPDKLALHFDFHYIRMHRSGSIDYSHGCNAELF